MFSPIAVPIVETFKITFPQFSLLGGYALLSTGGIGLFVAAGTRKYGKRPIWILSSIAAFAGCIWGAAAQSYGSFMGSRIIQGVSEAYFESVTYAFIGDLYFVHERGTRTAAAVICYQALSSFPPLVGGVVTRDLGWRWCFWLLGIFLGIGTILVIFFGFETAFKRQTIDASNVTNDEVRFCFFHHRSLKLTSTSRMLQGLKRLRVPPLLIQRTLSSMRYHASHTSRGSSPFKECTARTP